MKLNFPSYDACMKVGYDKLLRFVNVIIFSKLLVVVFSSFTSGKLQALHENV